MMLRVMHPNAVVVLERLVVPIQNEGDERSAIPRNAISQGTPLNEKLLSRHMDTGRQRQMQHSSATKYRSPNSQWGCGIPDWPYVMTSGHQPATVESLQTGPSQWSTSSGTARTPSHSPTRENEEKRAGGVSRH